MQYLYREDGNSYLRSRIAGLELRRPPGFFCRAIYPRSLQDEWKAHSLGCTEVFDTASGLYGLDAGPNPGLFDVWWHGSNMAEHVVIAAFAALVLGVVANALGYQADQAAPAQAAPEQAAPAAPVVTGVNPDSGSAGGGESVTVPGSGFTGATG